MKKYLIIVSVLIQLLLSNESIKYEVSLYRIPMANVEIDYKKISLNNKELISLQFETQTNRLASKIFKVNNTYETIIDPNTFDIISFKKNTYQPGISNQLNTIKKNDYIVYQNTDIIIPKNYFNIFSLLYYLTIVDFDNVKTNINLEREGLLYNCIIIKKNLQDTYQYELKFDLIDNKNIPVINETDMFTWAIFKKDAYRKIIVDKKSKKIKTCNFISGYTNLKAVIK